MIKSKAYNRFLACLLVLVLALSPVATAIAADMDYNDAQSAQEPGESETGSEETENEESGGQSSENPEEPDDGGDSEEDENSGNGEEENPEEPEDDGEEPDENEDAGEEGTEENPDEGNVSETPGEDEIQFDMLPLPDAENTVTVTTAAQFKSAVEDALSAGGEWTIIVSTTSSAASLTLSSAISSSSIADDTEITIIGQNGSSPSNPVRLINSSSRMFNLTVRNGAELKLHFENITLQGSAFNVVLRDEANFTLTGDHLVLDGNGKRVSTTIGGQIHLSGSGTALIEGTSDGEDKGLHIINSQAASVSTATLAGGAIYISGNNLVANVKNVFMDGNEARSGGSIYVSGATAHFENCTVSNSFASSFGGALGVDSGGRLYMKDCIIEDSEMGDSSSSNVGGGGAIISGDTAFLQLDNTIIRNNSAKQGGGVYIYSGGTLEVLNGSQITGNKSNGIYGSYDTAGPTVLIDNSTVADNTGTGVYIVRAGGELTIQNGSKITGNSSYGVYLGSGCQGTITDSEISGNKSAGISVSGSVLNIKNSTVERNTGSNGGGVYVASSGKAVIENSSLLENTASSNGGAGYATTGQIELINTKVSGNSANTNGGAFYITGNGGSLAVKNGSVIEGNTTATETSANAAAVYITGANLEMDGGTITRNINGSGLWMDPRTVNIANSVISEHKGNINGAGIYIKFTSSYSPKISMDNVTIEKNETSLNGGGIYFDKPLADAEVSLKDVTIEENQAAGLGGGIYVTADAISAIGMKGMEIKNNIAQQGGGIYATNTSTATTNPQTVIRMESSTVAENTALQEGGAVYLTTGTRGQIKLEVAEGSLFEENEAVRGGLVYLASSNAALEVSDSVLQKNTSSGGSGVISFAQIDSDAWKQVKLNNVQFAENTAMNYITNISPAFLAIHAAQITGTNTYSQMVEGAEVKQAYNNADIAGNFSALRIQYVDARGRAPADANLYTEGAVAEVLGLTDDTEVPGYQFMGWTTVPGGETAEYEVGDELTVGNTNVTLYSVWQQLEFTVVYHVNGLMNERYLEYNGPESITKLAGETLEEPDVEPTQMGYRFVGWYTGDGKNDNLYHYVDEPENTDAGGSWGEEWKFGEMQMPMQNLVLYARWEQDVFEVETEQELNAALSSNRKTISIDMLDNITLTGSMKFENPFVEAERVAVTVNLSSGKANNEYAHLTMGADEDLRHMYVKTAGINVTINLKNIIADSTHGYGGLSVENGAMNLNSVGENRSRITGMNKHSDGGAIYVGTGGTLNIKGMDITASKAASYGGGIYVYNADAVKIEDIKLIGNEAELGGGLSVRGTSAVILNGALIEDNEAKTGGGIYISQASAKESKILNVAFKRNTAEKPIHILGSEEAGLYQRLVAGGIVDESTITTDISDYDARLISFYNNYDIGYTGEFYTVTYHMPDGSTVTDDRYFGERAEVTLAFDNAPDEDYHQFMGWSTARNDAEALYRNEAGKDTLTITGDTHLYPVYQREEVTLTLNENKRKDGTDTEVVLTAQRGLHLPVPDGATFEEWQQNDKPMYFFFWSENPNALHPSEAFDFANVIVTDDITLYAIWHELPLGTYRIVFDSNGGSNINPEDVSSGNYNFTLGSAYIPVYPGYTFKGWEDKEGTLHLESTSIHVENSGLADDFRNIYLTAVWEETSFTVTATLSDASAGTLSVLKNEEPATLVNGKLEGVTVNDEVEITLALHNGYYLKDYTLTGDSTAERLSDTAVRFTGITSDIVIQGEMDNITYTVRVYDYDEAEPVLRARRSVVHGNGLNLNEVLAPSTGYDNLWYSAQTVTPEWEIANGQMTAVTQNMSVYRVQQKKEYQVTFDLQSIGTWAPGTTDPSGLVPYYALLTKPANPQAVYHTFRFWSTEADDEQRNHAWNFNQPVTGAITLYAQWDNIALGSESAQVAAELETYIDGVLQDEPVSGEYLGQDAELLVKRVTVNGSEEDVTVTRYDWYRVIGGIEVPIAGANTDTLNVTLQTPGTVSYLVKVTVEHDHFAGEGVGRAQQEIHVGITPPQILENPQDAAIKVGESTQLQVRASSQYDHTLSYQWYQTDRKEATGGTAIPGATRSTLEVSGEQAGSEFYYAVVLESHQGVSAYVTSEAAEVEISRNSSGGGKNKGPRPDEEEEQNAGGEEDGSGEQNIGDNGSFDDVSQDDWFFDAVEIVTDRGLFNGTGYRQFEPDAPITRAMFTTVLGRVAEQYAGAKITPASAKPFADVDLGTWYTDYVAWGKECSIIKGYSEQEFGPDDLLTREQLAAIMHRFLDYYSLAEDTSRQVTFADFDQVSDWAEENVKYIASAGLVNGYQDSTFRPLNNSTRAEVAQIIANYLIANDF